MSVKILLANLPWKRGGSWGVRAGSRWPHIKSVQEKRYLPFPFFLAYAGSLLEREGFEVKVIDSLAQELPVGDFLKVVSREKPDLLVAETSTPSLWNDLDILKKIPKDLPVALCGPETSIRDPEFLSQYKFIHYVFIGEYEFTLLELVQRLEEKKSLSGLCGLIYRDHGEFKVNPARSLLENLDDLPWPLRSGLPMEKYNDAPGGIPAPSVQMWSSRGCPYQCLFCVWPQLMYQSSRYRVRSVVKVVDEMEFLVKQMGFNSVYFDDDTTNIGKLRMMEFAGEIKRRDLNVPWAMMARADLMEEDILERLRSAGLFAVKYGVESSNQDLVNRICKNMDLRKTERMIRFTKSLGIKTHLTFSFGLPGETQETIQKTIDFAKALDPDTLQFSIATAFPGTRYFKELDQKGHIMSRSFSDYDGNFKSMLRTDSLSSQDLQKAKRRADQVWRAHVWETRHGHLRPADYFQKIKNRLQNYGPYSALSEAFSFLRGKTVFKLPFLNSKIFSAFHLRWDPSWVNFRGVLRNKIERAKQPMLAPATEASPKVFPSLFPAASAKCENTKQHLPEIKNQGPKAFKGKEALVITCPMWGTCSPPMGPAYIAAYLEKRRVPCEVLDLNITIYHAVSREHKGLWKMENFQLWSKEDTFGSIRQTLSQEIAQWSQYVLDQGFKTVGFSITGANALFSIEMAKILREKKPDICIVFGGPSCNFLHNDAHMPFRFLMSSVNREQLFDENLVDYIVLGEGEEAFFEIVSANRAGTLVNRPGVIPKTVRDRAMIRRPIFIRDLDSLPFPAWEKLPLDKYDEQDELPMLFTRGCVNRCAFCNDWSMWNGKYRCRSAKNIFKEIEHIRKHFGKKSFQCNDLLFNGNLKLLDQLADLLIKSKISIGWSAQGVVRTDMDLALLKKMKKAGLNAIIYGLESLADNVLHNMKKPFNFAEIREVLKQTKEAGITVCINLITGFPGETEENFKLTMERLKEIHAYVDIVSTLNPCNITASSELEMFPERFGIIFPPGRDRCEFWETADGTNTFEVRRRRAREMYELMKRLKIKVKFMGIYDGDSPLQKDPVVERAKDPFDETKVVLTPPLRKIKENLKKTRKHYLNTLGVLNGSYAFKGPDCVQIDLTSNCNNNCVSCWCNSPLLEDRIYRGSKKFKTLPTQLVKTVIDDLVEMGTSELFFSGGGEPFMHPDLLSIVEHAKGQGLNCSINTNFTLVKEETVRRLIEMQVDALTVSFWAATPETYALTHPNKDEAAFHRLKDVLTMLNSLKNKGRPLVKIYNVISNLNYREVEQMVAFAEETGSEAVEFTVVDTIPGATDKLALNQEQRREILAQCERILKRNNKVQVLMEHFMRRLSDACADQAQYDSGLLEKYSCYVGWVFSRIMPDGDVNFCLKAHRIPVGNLYKNSFREIWNSKLQREFREKALKFDKNDSFFQSIGNDKDCKMGCYKSCDDLGRNMNVQRHLNELSPIQKSVLRFMAKKVYKNGSLR